MKYIISFIAYILFSVTTCFAQSQIKKVYGVTLGDSQNNVIAILKSKESRGSWLTTQGKSFYRIQSPTLGSVRFKYANFYFSGGKLCNVTFFAESGGGTGDPEMSGYSQFQSAAKRNERIFRTMTYDLTEKYGSPIIQDEERVLWKQGRNQIEITFKYEDKDFGAGWRTFFTSLNVIYKIIDNSSSNY